MKHFVLCVFMLIAVNAQAQQCVEPDTTPMCKDPPPPSCADIRERCGESLTMSLPTEAIIESCTGSSDCLIEEYVSTHLMCGGAACVDSIYDPDEDTSDSDY